MSFRRRLLLSLLLILVVPVAIIVFLVVSLSEESRTGKADARLAGALPAVLEEFRSDLARAEAVAKEIARSPDFGAALAAPTLRQRATEVRAVGTTRKVVLLDVRGSGSAPVGTYRNGRPVALAEIRVNAPLGGQFRVTVSTTTASDFVAVASRSAGLPLALRSPDSTLTSRQIDGASLDLGGEVPRSSDVSVGGKDFRARILSLPGGGPPAVLALLTPQGESLLAGNGAFLVAAILAFFVLAALAIVPLFRGLDRQHGKVTEQAVTDQLTGLSNRRHLDEVLEVEVERSQRFDHDLSLLVLDIDDFKGVNDRFGHPEGDRVLHEVAEVIRAECRGIDHPARSGGEEFTVILPETTIEGAHVVGERICDRLRRTPVEVSGSDDPLGVTISIGAAGTPDHSRDSSVLIGAADGALYEAKRAGKDRVLRAPPSGGKPLSLTPDGRQK